MTYYGFANHYGKNTRDEKGLRLGTVHTFKTQKDRNEWANCDEAKREVISYRDAKKLIDPIYPVFEDHPFVGFPFLSTKIQLD